MSYGGTRCLSPSGRVVTRDRIPTVLATGWMSFVQALGKADDIIGNTEDLRGRVFIEGSTRASTVNYRIPPQLNVEIQG